jgi:hypothetical protein
VRAITAVAICLALAGCKERTIASTLSEFGPDQAAEARRAVTAFRPENAVLVAICGESSGVGLFGDQRDEGWMADGLKDGRLAFFAGEEPDVVFKDASGKYISAVKDGGVVTRVSGNDQVAESAWTVSYQATGVIETHNITRLPDGDLVDFWTSNKPPVLVGASVKAFQAKCVRA